uniref:Titin-like n=2 Tax=Gouania willdenowi TaxID=441366 RepID=A0A8C5D061_GOUWI
MKKPLISTSSKGKDKSEGKVKGAKDKTSKESKEKPEDKPQDQKQKKEHEKDKKFVIDAKKETTAELVPFTPPPKVIPPKKKNLFGFMKSTKKDSCEVTADPIIDAPTSDIPGPAPLIPVPSDFGNPYTENSEPILPNTPTLSDSIAGVEMIPPPIIPESPDFIPPPAFIPDIPAPEIPNIEFENPLQVEDPASTGPIPSLPSYTIASPPLLAPDTSPSPAESNLAAETGIEAVSIAAVETPPAPVIDPPQIHPSPKLEHPMSAISALERAEDMLPEKKGRTVDQRILGALQKARKKTSPLATPTRRYSPTPPPGDTPPSQSPTSAWLDLPPIDYDGSGSRRPAQPAQLNGTHQLLEGISEEKPDPTPELLVVPPPPPQSLLPSEPVVVPEKPARHHTTNFSEFVPPPLVQDNGVTVPSEFSETKTTNFPEFYDLPSAASAASGALSPELPESQWGHEEYTNQNVVEKDNLPQFHSNGISLPKADVNAEPVFEDDYQQIVSDKSLVAGPPEENGACESLENTYEELGASPNKKKSKTDNTKKRKGPPKNPYAEPGQEPKQEKAKASKSFKAEKKAVVDGVDEKESTKKEKQRLKKELKEKQEKEKKEQKEKEKKESEMKKKFKITGQEDAIYQAKVTMTTKGRKNDLPVQSGDIVSVIRTTNCPKGKWLARDSSNNYGYVAVDHVELDIQEMLELGKKARKTSSKVVEPDGPNKSNTVPNHYPLSAESFDSEEWTGDEDEHVSRAAETADPSTLISHSRAVSAPAMANNELSINHQHSHSDSNADGAHMQAKHEALQKLATFFHSPKTEEATARTPERETSPVHAAKKAVHTPKASTTQGVDFGDPNTIILPPPDLYA